jgi:hypothetical protein
MNWKLASVALAIFGSSLVALPGCAADSVDTPDDGSADEEASSEEDLKAAAAKLVGAYAGGTSNVPPTFQGLVFKSDGTFFADIDTGIRCITTPCPSNERLTGTFTATKNYVRLSPKAGEAASANHARYRYTLSAGRLSLSRPDKKSWSGSVTKQASYCAAAVDCQGQSMILPKCMGTFSCGTTNPGANACVYTCGGTPTTDVWPSDATRLVTKSSGGGFTPPPPPGSTCRIGQFSFDLDVATKTLAWESCKFTSWQTPLTAESGTKTLSAADMAKIEAALDQVTISTQDICGADKPALSMTVTSTSGGTKEYKDSFYACMKKGTYVDNIDEVNSALRAAAGL